MVIENCCVIGLSEKFKFFSQNEIQSVHWNRTSAVLHPFVAYYKEQGQSANEEPKSLSYVVISNVEHQDNVTVHLFVKCFMDYVRNGAVSQ
jgi:hypothetical protein